MNRRYCGAARAGFAVRRRRVPRPASDVPDPDLTVTDLAPGAGADSVVEVGERIRRAVGETEVADGDVRITVNVSLGGAVYGPTTDSPDALIALADRALYDAKEGGRNRLQMANR